MKRAEGHDSVERYRTNKRFCPHCEEDLTLKTYKLHKRLYYNESSNEWFTLSNQAEDTDHSETPPATPSPISIADGYTSDPMVSPPVSVTFEPEVDTIDDNGDSLPSTPEEVWDEGDEVVTEITEDSEPETEFRGETESESKILSTWLVMFLLYVQAVYKLTDRAVTAIMSFLKAFLKVLSRLSRSVSISRLAEIFPTSLYLAKTKMKGDCNHDNFKRYVVCSQCHNLYQFNDCVEGTGRARRVKVCSFVAYPNHPHRSRRQPCSNALLKTVELATGRKIYYPYLVYCYLGVKQPLQKLLSRPSFFEICEQWRSREAKHDILSDIYDGNIWKNFQQYEGQPFLSEPGCFALMMNMDFFQPFKHVNYSLGAIYCTVMNLPRSVRFKVENALLIGLIPGPREPEETISTYLQPFVDEMKQLWIGVEMDISGVGKKRIRSALLCVACDMPGGRKVCGFLSHTAALGCSRCLKRFPGPFGSLDYSGFDRNNWPPRNDTIHRAGALRHKDGITKAERDKAASESGCRYSVLLELPYFDAPRMNIVDPMHNLFLGSAKHVFKNAFLSLLLTESDLGKIQDRVNSTVVPPDIGRIPQKIASGFSKFTADQWKNWTVYYSPLILHDLISRENRECWQHFTLACRLLCKHELSTTDIIIADGMLLQFCRRVENLYGKEIVTPNMHMHGHIRSCIEDYGPYHNFWLYAFERYNGVLGSMPNNNRSIEIQFMARFIAESSALSFPFPDNYGDDFKNHFQQHLSAVGSLAETLHSTSTCATSLPRMSKWTVDSLCVSLPSHSTRHILDHVEMDKVTELYSSLYCSSVEESITSLNTTTSYLKYSSIHLNNKVVGSCGTRSASSSIVYVTWNTDIFGEPSDSHYSSSITTPGYRDQVRPARINYFLLNKVYVGDMLQPHLLVSLSWFKCHPKVTCVGKPVTVWYEDIFLSFGVHSIIPVQFISSRSVSLKQKLDGETVLFVCPCINF